MVRILSWRRRSRMEIARAAPSSGSVPAHNSSKRTRECGVACFRMETMFVIWEEKVLRLCSILCSSPISAYTSSKIASSERSFAGMCNPACPIRVNRPTVFKETVLPPVFGPVTISRWNSSPRWTSMGTTFFGFSSGCRPWRIRIRPSVLKIGAIPFWIFARFAFAKIKSRSVRIW